ncbi:MAG: hypothetical protein HQ512_03605 [Rhodospirillales bacterium]|nr:hypothetical protein [Rhodospirillales bacterium]
MTEAPQAGAKASQTDKDAAFWTWPLAFVIAFVAFVHVVWWFLGDTVVAHGNLADSDGYARLVRVERLLATGGWFDSSLPRANWPFGGSLHWTRLFDVLIIALALPMTAVVGMSKALYWSGVLISPLLHIGTALVLAWAAKPLIGRTAALIAGALTATQFGVLGYSVIGHADHHALFGLIAIGVFGFMVRAFVEGVDKIGGVDRYALAAGGCLAAGYWVGMEMQITAALCFGVMGLKWLQGDGPGNDNESLGSLYQLALGLAVGLAAAVLIERGPQGFFDDAYDRVSIVQLTLAVLVLAFWGAVSFGAKRGRVLTSVPGRLGAVVLGGGMTLLVMWWLFPKVFVNPLKDFDPVILKVFEGVAEYAPISDIPHFLLYIGAGVIAGPWMLWRLKTEGAGRRWAWLLLAASALVYGALAMNWIRWSFYVGLFMTVGLADLVRWVDGAVNKRFVFPFRMLVKVPVVLLLAIGPLAVGATGVYTQTKAADKEKTASGKGDPRPCPVQALSDFLNKPPWSDRPRAILSSANFGAEFLYRTKHRVTATLHHPNAQGILDSIDILGGIYEAKVLHLINKRQVGLILICPKSGHDGYLMKGGGDKTFYKRLMAGNLPDWMRPVALPPDLSKSFLLFQVMGADR